MRKVHVQFDELVMADGETVALHTVASPAPDGVLRFVSANEADKKKNKVQQAASNKVSAARTLPSYCSFAYSALACFRIGTSGSASFQSVRKSL